MAANFKLGRHEPGVGLVEHRHAGVYERRHDRSAYLHVGAAASHTALLARLADELEPPYTLEYSLLAAAGPYLEGVYRLACELDRARLRAFLADHGEFFEQDARHEVRILGPAAQSGRLVYDQHDFILAYGPLDAFEWVLQSEGLRVGSADLPIPHSHHIRPEYDADLFRLMDRHPWVLASGAAEG